MKHLLLLHGAIGSAANFENLVPLLEKDFIIHNLDLPGHGGTEMPHSFSIELFAQHVESYCTINGLNEVNVFGYSMGGYVAVFLAHLRPSLFEKIITLGTVFNWNEEISAKESLKLQPAILEIKVPKFASALENMHRPNNWKDVVEKTAAMLTQLGRNHLLPIEILSGIKVPCLVMLGDRDKMVDRQHTIKVYEAMPQSELAILPGTPHPVEQCDPKLLSMMIRRFIY